MALATAHAVLGLLARVDQYGYALRHGLEDEFGPDWRIDFGHLYRVLASMTRRGWVTVRVEPALRGPRRKMYSITAAGRAELRRWLSDPGATSERGRDEFALKLHLGMSRRSASTTRLVARRRRGLEQQHRTQQQDAARARESRHVGRWLAADAQRRHTEATLAALETCSAITHARRPSRRSASPDALVAIGSDDLVLDLLARRLAERHPEIHFSSTSVGSMGGLLALSEGRADLAGIHLLDVDSGEYNAPFVRHLMPEEPVMLVNLARREQGLMVAPGNPKGIERLRDLTRGDVRLINRQRGAGTRLLLFHRLRQARIDPRQVAGYERAAATHNAVAAAIIAGSADVGLGIRAVAEAWGLDFIPLGQERYDLAIPRKVFESPQLRPLLEVLHQREFRRAAAVLPGYDVSHMSRVLANLH